MFEQYRRANNDATGPPTVGLIEADEAGGWRLRFTPTPNAAYTYVIPYLCKVTPLAAASTPAWPSSFHRGWHAMASMHCQRRFGVVDKARFAEREFAEWYAVAVKHNDQQLVRSERIESDAYNDFNPVGLDADCGYPRTV